MKEHSGVAGSPRSEKQVSLGKRNGNRCAGGKTDAARISGEMGDDANRETSCR